MASKQSTIDYIVEQISDAGDVRSRKMFGEFAIYCNEKVVALICDDQLFIKPTDSGRKFLDTVQEAPPYPGAKPYFLIDAEKWDDREWLSQLIIITTADLPLPKPKRKRPE
jgi:TfoX/Sxy family transcriptional regulator of competence genes